MKKLTLITAMMIGSLFCQGQVSILNTNLSSLNVTPESLCQANIMNGTSSEMQVTLEAKLFNSTGENVLTVKTNPFRLIAGMNNGFQLNYSIQSILYSGSGQAQYIRTMHILPSGNFKYCISITSLTGEGGDDYCEDFVSDISSFLNLVYPYDKDTIDTKYPLLMWTHSEPFNLLSTGEYYRMTVVELNTDQSAEGGILANNPIYFQNFLSSHQQQYPTDADDLEEGKRYAWQVQKISNGTIIDKTEAWEFCIRKQSKPSENKYGVLKKKTDGGFYTVENNKVFFKFNESYNENVISCKIYDDNRNAVQPVVKNETDKNPDRENINVKSNGVNLFEIDLDQFNMSSGFYMLEVLNGKKEKYLLKIFVE